MFELFLPYLIATVLGVSPEPSASVAVVPEVSTAAVEAIAVATAPPPATRAPEDQTPTGRFTTAGEVRMILSATKTQWIAVRPYDGQDLLYFTQLASWRCGLWDVSYGLNGAEPVTPFPLEPCHDDTATPNAMTQIESYLPYLALPADSVQSVKVRITYDDGTTDEAIYGRAMVLIP